MFMEWKIAWSVSATYINNILFAGKLTFLQNISHKVQKYMKIYKNLYLKIIKTPQKHTSGKL